MRFESTFVFLQRYQKEGKEFLDKIVTGDETCIHISHLEWNAAPSSRNIPLPRHEKCVELIHQREK